MENYGLGCKKPLIDIRDYKVKKRVACLCEYPETFSCGPAYKIKSQGAVSSCVAHATSEILEYHYKKDLSTNFIYGVHNELYNSEGPGMHMREACKIACKYGDPEIEYCPGNDEVPRVYDIALLAFKNPVAMQNAGQFKIGGYAKLLNDGCIKYALMNYGPVLASVQWYSDNTVSIGGLLTKGTRKSGYHAFVISGQDSRGQICWNSWGKTQGRVGCFNLPFNYGLSEAFSFIPADSTDVTKPKRNAFFDFFYMLANSIINFVRRANK